MGTADPRVHASIMRLVFTAVPEPRTWTIMLLGFGALGYSLRNQRPKVTVSYA